VQRQSSDWTSAGLTASAEATAVRRSVPRRRKPRRHISPGICGGGLSGERGGGPLWPPWLIAFILCILISVSARGRAQTPDTGPLPDAAAFAAEVKSRLRTDRALQAQYTFLERREEIEVSKLGKVKKGSVKEYEVYPSIVPGNTYKRLITVDGRPLDAAQLMKNDEKHRKDVLAETNESPAARRKREQENAKLRAEERQVIDEIFSLYDIRVVGRDTVNGYPTIVATLEPRPKYVPKTDDARVMKKFRVRAWVHEADYQVVKIDAEAIGDLTFGWGIIGRLHKGARAVLERRKVNDEVWLPARVHVIGTGRAVMFRKFAIDSVTEWFDYKKFSVKTDQTYTEQQP
jgi:hypothetical protein